MFGRYRFRIDGGVTLGFGLGWFLDLLSLLGGLVYCYFRFAGLNCCFDS